MNYGNLYWRTSDKLHRAATHDELVRSLQAIEEGTGDHIVGPEGGPTGDGVVGLIPAEPGLLGEWCYVSRFSPEALAEVGGVPDDWKPVLEGGVIVAFDFNEPNIVCPRCGKNGKASEFPPNVVSECPECSDCGYEGTDDPTKWEAQFVRQ